MPNPRVAHSVFCDDVRFEMGNKLSLMGIYSSEVIIYHSFPVALPKFCVQVWIVTDLDDKVERLTTTVVLPGGHEIVRAEMVVEAAPIPDYIREGAQKAIVSQTLPFGPLPLTEEGMIEVWVETEREKIRAGRIWIKSQLLPENIAAFQRNFIPLVPPPLG